MKHKTIKAAYLSFIFFASLSFLIGCTDGGTQTTAKAPEPEKSELEIKQENERKKLEWLDETKTTINQKISEFNNMNSTFVPGKDLVSYDLATIQKFLKLGKEIQALGSAYIQKANNGNQTDAGWNVAYNKVLSHKIMLAELMLNSLKPYNETIDEVKRSESANHLKDMINEEDIQYLASETVTTMN